MYKEATKRKLRFETPIGYLTVEQLWELPLHSKTKVDLNDVAVTVNQELKPTDDFVGLSTNINETAELKMSIVKDIIADKKADMVAKATANKKAEELSKLDELIKQKEIEELSAVDLATLKAKRDELAKGV